MHYNHKHFMVSC